MSTLRNELPALLLLWNCDGMFCLIIFTSFISLCEPLHCRSSTGSVLKERLPTDVVTLLKRDRTDVAFLLQTTDLTVTCLCCTSILVNLLPFGQNSSGVLFSSVSSTSSAQGMVANWHHTGSQDLWDSLSLTERESFLNTPSQKTINFFCCFCLAANQ